MLIVGVGALGASLAQYMVRAGVGEVKLADRDYVKPSNLQRQMLFDEADALAVLPKAVAAANKLRHINSDAGCVNRRCPRDVQHVLTADRGMAGIRMITLWLRGMTKLFTPSCCADGIPCR